VKATPRFDAILFWSTNFAGWTRLVAGLRA
jgi:hypothetical protein